jgi:hypothetical protein
MDLLQNTIKDPSFNSVSHRCKEVPDVLGPNLDFRKYFLVLGDNAGLHMHQPVEETWPYLVSKETSYRYYNACIIDGGYIFHVNGRIVSTALSMMKRLRRHQRWEMTLDIF